MPSFNRWSSFYTNDFGIVKTIIIGIFQNLLTAAQFLPTYISQWLTGVLRILFFSVITFAAWIKTYPVYDFPATFSQVVLALSAGYGCYVHSNRNVSCWPEREKMIRESYDQQLAQTSEWLQKELDSKRSICDTLGDVTVTLEESERKQKEMENNERKLKKETNNLQQTIKDLKKYNENLEIQINKRREEILEAKAKFERKIGEMEVVVTGMREQELRNLEIRQKLEKETTVKEDLDKTNIMLQTSVEVMGKQRKKLLQRQNAMERQIIDLQKQNESLRVRLNSTHDMGELDKITERLQTSISSAKGKLAKVRGVLKDDGDLLR